MDAEDSLDAVLSSWPEKPREAVNTLMAKYGPPDEVTESQILWHNNGPWLRTIVYREEIAHEFPAPHTDFVEQVIPYRVPPELFDELAAYDGSVIVERTKGEMSARCDMEELNLLALNLANDIVTGERTVEEARQFYAETASAFKAGEMPAYTQALQFEVASNTADPDMAAMTASRE